MTEADSTPNEPSTSAPNFLTTELLGIHPAVRSVWIAQIVINLVVFGTIGFLIEHFAVKHRPAWIAPSIIGLMALYSFIVIPISFRNWKWQLRRYEIELRHGVFSRTRRVVDRERVQHVDLRSGPIDRMLGLVHVTIHTAGAGGSVGRIPGLTPEQGDFLREQIFATRREDA